MKIMEIQLIIKKQKNNRISIENHKKYEINRIPYENHENNENDRIP